MKDRLMRQKEAADYLRISKWTLYRWTKNKSIRVYKVGGLNLYKEQELEKFVDGFRQN